MDATEAILTRRSTRRYTTEPVPDDLIEALLRAAMAAPSAGNQQPWHFVVIRDRATLNAIPQFHSHSEMLREAPVAVLICGGEWMEQHEVYWVQDCSAATQNLLLEAHARGLGAVWLGMYPREERVQGLRRLLSIPEHIVPFALISIGRPAEHKEPANRFDATRVHRERW